MYRLHKFPVSILTQNIGMFLDDRQRFDDYFILVNHQFIMTKFDSFQGIHILAHQLLQLLQDFWILK